MDSVFGHVLLDICFDNNYDNGLILRSKGFIYARCKSCGERTKTSILPPATVRRAGLQVR